MKKQIKGNFIARYTEGENFCISAEQLSRGCGIDFERMTRIIAGDVEVKPTEKTMILEHFHNRSDLPNLEENDLFPTIEEWREHQERVAAIASANRGGVNPEDIRKENQRIQEIIRERNKRSRQERERGIADKILMEQGHMRVPVKLKDETDGLEIEGVDDED